MQEACKAQRALDRRWLALSTFALGICRSGGRDAECSAQLCSSDMFHLSIREEIAATMIAELVYQMAYTALRAPEIDKSNASYRPLSHRTLVDAHRSRA